MAQSKTSAKRARTAEANRLRNKSFKSKLKTSIKKFEETIDQTEVDVETARENLISSSDSSGKVFLNFRLSRMALISSG